PRPGLRVGPAGRSRCRVGGEPVSVAATVPTAVKLRVVLYEGDGSRPLESAARYELIRTLLEKGYAITAARNGGASNHADGAALVVLGQFDQAKPAVADGDGGAKVYF